MKVHFLIGGTEPGGINQLYHLLNNHEEILLPPSPQPEPNFFSKDVEYEKGYEYYHERYFRHSNAERVIGEKSGRYLWHPKAAERIHEYNPDIKLIFMLRDPALRAYSNYRFNCMNGIEGLSFSEALKEEPKRLEKAAKSSFWRDIQPFAYFEKGLYARQLKRYKALFPPENICVIKNEHIRTDSQDEIARILKFLGLSSEKYEHHDDSPQYPSFHVCNLQIQKLFRSINRSLIEQTLQCLRAEAPLTLAQRIVSLNMSSKRTHPPDDVVAALRARLPDEMNELQRMIDFDISDWSN